MLNELNNFVYENHLGKRFVGMENGVYMNHGNILDYSWDYDTLNSKISRFYRSIESRKIPLVVIGKTDAEAIKAKNKLFEIAESDVIAMIPGKVYVGEYYTQGYITASTKSKYLESSRFSKINLTLISDNPIWYREHLYRFTPTPSEEIGEGFDYPFDYPYDYSSKAKTAQTIDFNSIGGNEFRIVIYGAVSNPTIKIGDHEYSIEGEIGAGETLLIDSIAKKITLTSQVGQKHNWFDKRSRDSYIFEPISSGHHVVSWDGSFGFDLTVIEKRSEPKWI